MITTKFWEGLGAKLADQWIVTTLTPAFVFWLGGLLAWITHYGLASLHLLETQLTNLLTSLIAQGAFLIGVLLIILASSTVVQQLDLPIIRLLEGYWPRWLKWLQRWGVDWQNKQLKSAEDRWQELEHEKEVRELRPEENEEQVALDSKLRLAPADPLYRMPTKLGNILRAAEIRPLVNYGLETTICWPRLWLLLPDNVKNELTEARTSLDTNVRILVWGILFFVWTIWAPWALLIGLAIVIWAYYRALRAAEVYGDLLDSAFDLHRFALYETLHWPRPEQPNNEEEKGTELTRYLYRGLAPASVKFQYSSENQPSPQTSSNVTRGLIGLLMAIVLGIYLWATILKRSRKRKG